MADENDELLTELADAVVGAIQELAWIKKGAKDNRDVMKVIRSRKKLDIAIEAYARFSDEIENLDFNDEQNNKWFDKWREIKSDLSELQARMERTVGVIAHDNDEDAFNSDDDEPHQEGIEKSLQMSDDIKATIDKDIARLADILAITEELKELADHCLEELEAQRERLLMINAKLKAIDKSVAAAEGVLDRIKRNMHMNKCCCAIGWTVIILLVIVLVVPLVVCLRGKCRLSSDVWFFLKMFPI